jgi:hypothetical protein
MKERERRKTGGKETERKRMRKRTECLITRATDRCKYLMKGEDRR